MQKCDTLRQEISQKNSTQLEKKVKRTATKEYN